MEADTGSTGESARGRRGLDKKQRRGNSKGTKEKGVVRAEGGEAAL